MLLSDKEYIQNVINLTKTGNINWDYMEDQECFASGSGSFSSAICKCISEDGKDTFIYSDTDERGLLLEDPIECSAGDDNYNLLESLYTFIETKINVK